MNRLRALGSQDFIVGAAVAVFGLLFLLEAQKIKDTADAVGPKTFPTLVAIGLIVLGLVTAVRALVAGRAAGPARPNRRTLVLFGIFFVYLLILIPVGFLLSTAAFIFAAATVCSRAHMVRSAVFAVVFSAVVYFSFTYGLAVYLPAGILG